MRGKQRAVGIPARPRAQGHKNLVGVAKIRTGVLDNAAEIFERLSLRGEDGPHAPIEREAAKIQAPGDASAFEITLERVGKGLRL